MKHISIFTGHQHGINWEIFASDDEPTYDREPDLDQVAYERWRDDQIDDWYFN